MFTVFCISCVNPFAPKLDNEISDNEGLLSDQTNVDGIFKNFQYSYTFKDTTIYSSLLAKDFTFNYRDYDIGADVSWSKSEELRVTDGLFSNTERLDLVWNNIVTMTGDSTNIIRSFNLTVTFNPTDIVFVDGRVNLLLRKDEGKWYIVKWTDESNF